MKVAVVCPYSIDEPGGVQTQTVDLVGKLREAGHQAWLVAPGSHGPPGTRSLGTVIRVRSNASVAPIAVNPTTVNKTRRAVRDADVVHVHEPLLAPVSPAAFLGNRPPAIGTFHADPTARIRNMYRLAAPLGRRILSKLRACTAVSQTAGSAVRHLVEDLVLIPNGIDSRAFSNPGIQRSERVVFMGRDEPRKGLDVLLAAWPEVRLAVPSAELVVLGVSREHRFPGVRFAGRVGAGEKRRHLAEASVYCAPNLGGESFGISLIEAMAAGCAPVVSDLRAFRDVAGEVATYAAVGRPADLATKLIGVLADPITTGQTGLRSVERAAAYDWDNLLPEYLNLYRQAAG